MRSFERETCLVESMPGHAAEGWHASAAQVETVKNVTARTVQGFSFN